MDHGFIRTRCEGPRRIQLLTSTPSVTLLQLLTSLINNVNFSFQPGFQVTSSRLHHVSLTSVEHCVNNPKITASSSTYAEVGIKYKTYINSVTTEIIIVRQKTFILERNRWLRRFTPNLIKVLGKL